MENNYKRISSVFKALSDENRIRILELLQEGEKCACVLLDRLELTQSGLSYHMKILCDSGLVFSRQDGKWTHYRLDKKGQEQAIELIKSCTTPNIERVNECC